MYINTSRGAIPANSKRKKPPVKGGFAALIGGLRQ
jgi:hypothetical protein